MARLFSALALVIFIACGSSKATPSDSNSRATKTSNELRDRRPGKAVLLGEPTLQEGVSRLELGCASDIDEGCNALDDDCDGKVDEGCGYRGNPLQVTIAWNSGADVDLLLYGPSGERISYHQPSAPSGVRMKHEGRGACDSRPNARVESIAWRKPPPGKYRVGVHYWGECQSMAGRTTVTLSVAIGTKVIGPFNVGLAPATRRKMIEFSLAE